LPSGEGRGEYILGLLIATTVAAMSGVAVGVLGISVGVTVAIGLGVKVSVIAGGIGFVACNVAVNAGTDGSGVVRGRQPPISQMNARIRTGRHCLIDLILSG
jgi:hypothetical protein